MWSILSFFFSCFIIGYLNTDNSTQDKLVKLVLPPCPAHLLPDISTQMAKPAMWCNTVGNLPTLSPQMQEVALKLRTVEAGINHYLTYATHRVKKGTPHKRE